MKAGNVATAEVGPILERLVRERWPHDNGCEMLSQTVGCDESAVRSVMEQRHEGVAFDFADRLFCALGQPMEHVGLADTFWTVEFRETCALHSCSHTFKERFNGPTRKRYCSPRCATLGNAVKQGRATGERLRQKGMCLKGHRMTPENTIVKERNGRAEYQCRECKRTKQREWLRKKKLDPAFREKALEATRRWRERTAA